MPYLKASISSCERKLRKPLIMICLMCIFCWLYLQFAQWYEPKQHRTVSPIQESAQKHNLPQIATPNANIPNELSQLIVASSSNSRPIGTTRAYSQPQLITNRTGNFCVCLHSNLSVLGALLCGVCVLPRSSSCELENSNLRSTDKLGSLHFCPTRKLSGAR
jgi:hypothetical protein